jgi:glutaredoxin-related protein
MCPWCRDCEENLEANHIPFEVIDINESLGNLSDFLELRDTLPVFDHSKEIHDIGLPALVKEDGTVFLNWEEWLDSQGMKWSYHHVQTGNACSIDGSGC